MELAEALKKLQADVVTAYFQIHGYHWNVEGMLFPEMHAKFLEIYEDVYESIDDISEMLRKLNTPAPHMLEQFMENRNISSIYFGNSAIDQIESFLMSNEMLLLKQRDKLVLREILKLENQHIKSGIGNFLAQLKKQSFNIDTVIP